MTITPERVCKVLEGMCMLEMYEKLEDGKYVSDPQFSSMVYRFCHIAQGGCKNQHKYWREQFLDQEQIVLLALESPAAKRKRLNEDTHV